MKIKSTITMLAALGCVAVIPTTVKAQVMLASLVRHMPPTALPAAVVASPAPAVMVMPAASAPAEGGQVKDDLFAGTEKFAKDAKEVTEVNLDKNMLSMVNGKGKGGDVAQKLEFVVVHTYEYDKPGMYRMEDFEVFRKRLSDGSWNCMIHTRERDGSTDICTRSIQNGEATELVVMTAEPREVTFVHIGGHGLNLSDLSKIGGVMHGAVPTPPTPPTPPLNKR